MGKGFSKRDSTIVKGIALLAMMWHHCFLPGRFEGYNISFSPFTQHQVEVLAQFFKICVPLFAFISGFGLCCSLQDSFPKTGNITKTSLSKWYLHRIFRTGKGYWFVVVLMWIVTFIIDRRPVFTYFSQGIVKGVAYMILDFLGLANIY